MCVCEGGAEIDSEGGWCFDIVAVAAAGDGFSCGDLLSSLLQRPGTLVTIFRGMEQL